MSSLKDYDVLKQSYKSGEATGDVDLDWCSIFNHKKYFDLHKTVSSLYFVLQNIETKTITGVCHFAETEKGIYISPLTGTFAGPELKAGFSELLPFFMQDIENTLKLRGASKIVLRLPPVVHDPAFSIQLEQLLTLTGYEIMSHDMSYVIETDEESLADKMNRNNRRILKKCVDANYVFEQVFTPADFEQVYNVIAANRRYNGYSLSMTFEQIMQMQRTFAGSLFFFKCTKAQQIAAGAICIKINSRVLYVFYWGELPEYKLNSPVVFLAEGIYNFARNNKFRLLDAGVSSIEGKAIPGLIKFKEGLGFRPSAKTTYTKSL